MDDSRAEVQKEQRVAKCVSLPHMTTQPSLQALNGSIAHATQAHSPPALSTGPLDEATEAIGPEGLIQEQHPPFRRPSRELSVSTAEA